MARLCPGGKPLGKNLWTISVGIDRRGVQTDDPKGLYKDFLSPVRNV
jgi:hypothetical protein